MESRTFALDFEGCMELCWVIEGETSLSGKNRLGQRPEGRTVGAMSKSVLVWLGFGPCGAEVEGVKVQRAGGVY